LGGIFSNKKKRMEERESEKNEKMKNSKETENQWDNPTTFSIC
jgi:hypothetical protein